ncbi:MAG: hypothetical protein KA187_03795 [Arenimonas sp.]|nr:hypothetical protein [Arenimonas sp.]
MLTLAIPRKMLLALLLAVVLPVEAKVARMQVDTVRSELGTLQDVAVTLAWPDGAPEGELEMRVARLDFPLLSLQATDLVWRCPLQSAADGRWVCRGSLAGPGVRAGQLALEISPAATRADIALGKSRISYQAVAAAPDLSTLQLQAVPVAWLQAFLAELWADGQWTQGQLAGTVEIALPADQSLQVRTDLALSGLGLETPDGWLAAADLQARLEMDYRQAGADTRVAASLTTTGGEFLADGFYAQLPASPVRVALTAEQSGTGAWRLPALSLRDGQVLQAQGSATLDADAAVNDLALDIQIGDLAVARDRYLSGFLAPAGFADLVLSGAARARLRLQAGQWRDLSVGFTGVNAIDPRQRFILAGLQGGLGWTAEDAEVTSELAWNSAALYGIGLEASRFGFRSVDGTLALQQPSRVGALGGAVSLDAFRWQPPTDSHGARFELGVTLDALDLGSLSQRLGWPPFTGRVTGRIPGARYADGVLRLDGGLAMALFEGEVALSELVMERPFGIAPTLSADVTLRGINLEPLTAAFGFGSITGRLDGQVSGLRLVDWSPVAFDARLYTDEAWKGRRRISQRAVQDISKVGGAGLVAGLQTQVLKVFDDFGYARIGLSCLLRDNVCTMDGVGSAGDGYIIVEGAGLPRIQVVGFRRQVDWPTLLARLEAATEGQAPIIQ